MSDSSNKKTAKSFVHGALILGIANLVVKLIGAGFKIPLVNLIGDDGSGYFNVAYQIYTFIFIVATAGFPVAISKMVSESISRGNNTDAQKIFKVAITFLSIIGLIGTLILFIFSDQIAGFAKSPDASLSIATIAPAIFFVALSSAYRGYFQGRQNMYPTAFSEVIESSGKMIIGLIGAWFFINMAVDGSLGKAVDFASGKLASEHTKTIFASAGAIFGVTSGTFLSCALLTLIYVFSRKKQSLSTIDNARGSKEILGSLIKIAIPITIGASVSSLTSLIDMGTINYRLVVRPEVFERYAFMFSEGTDFFKKAVESGWQGAELLSHKATSLYGMYTGKALTLFNFPLTLVVALGTSVVPAISTAAALSRRNEAKRITESSIRIVVLFAAPCAFGMAVLSKEILNLLFNDCNAFSVLSILAAAIIPVGIVQVTNAILQAYGMVYKPVKHMIIGGIIKVLVNFFCIPYLGIDGAPVGTGICYLVIAILNVRTIIKFAGIDFKWSSFIIKPILAAAIMGGAGFVMSSFLPLSKTLCIIEIGICGIVYVFAALAIRAIGKDDILMLPKGEKLLKILGRFGLIK